VVAELVEVALGADSHFLCAFSDAELRRKLGLVDHRLWTRGSWVSGSFRRASRYPSG